MRSRRSTIFLWTWRRRSRRTCWPAGRLAMVYLGDLNQAALLSEAALKVNSDDTYVRYARAVFLAANGQSEQSLELLVEICEAEA